MEEVDGGRGGVEGEGEGGRCSGTRRGSATAALAICCAGKEEQPLTVAAKRRRQREREREREREGEREMNGEEGKEAGHSSQQWRHRRASHRCVLVTAVVVQAL